MGNDGHDAGHAEEERGTPGTARRDVTRPPSAPTGPAEERPPRIYTVEDAARILRIQRPKVREAILFGELRAARIGRLFRIREDDLLRYFDACVVCGRGSPCQRGPEGPRETERGG